ncbi:MAG: hypothetical protein IJK61_06865 [Bacteroidetes bacterium]|nr:hypothetical protein [Bacteroidota bacterium]
MSENIKDNIKNNKISELLIDIIESNRGKITPSEAAAKTGYSLDEIAVALDRLLELYEVRVTLDQETGKLVYIFKYPLFERKQRTFKEKLAAFISLLYKGFQLVYKAAVGVVLIFYTVLFLIILLVMFSTNSNRDEDRGSGVGDVIAAIFHAILESMHIVTYQRIIEQAYTPNGDMYMQYKPEKNKGKNFIYSVFSFVFGPEQPKIDPLANAKEILSYIRLYNKGKLTTSNIVELAGGNFEKAESKLAEYAGKYSADLEISNNGVLYGDFKNIMDDTISPEEAKNIEYYKDEVEPPVEFTGNSGRRNFIICIMNGFNLLMSAMFFMNSEFVQMFLLENFEISEMAASIITAGISIFPLVVSILYFLIPILRYPSYSRRKKKRPYNLMHKKLVGYICSQRKMDFNVNEFYFLVKSDDRSQEKLLKKVLEDVRVELEGTVEMDEQGKVFYRFERLYNELTFVNI